MMLYPAMGELNARIHNRYMLVNVVARRARQIAEAYESAHQPLDEKPVTMAINEVADGVLDDPEQMPPEPDAEAEEASDGAEAADDMEADDEGSEAEADDGAEAVDEAEADDGAEAVDEAEADGGAEAVDEEEPDGESAEGVEPKTSAEAD